MAGGWWLDEWLVARRRWALSSHQPLATSHFPLPPQKLGRQLKCFTQQGAPVLAPTEKIVQDRIGRLRIGLMRSRGQQLHDHGEQGRQKLNDHLRIQTGALSDFADQSIQPFPAKQVFDFIKACPRLRQIRHRLLDSSLATGLLLLG